MNEKMIHNVARKLYIRYVANTEHEARITLDDLIHAGVIGWLEAEKRLDGERSSDAASYFYLNIQGRMMDLIRKQPLVRMPQVPYTRLKAVMAVKKELEATGKEATSAEIADKLTWDVAEVNSLLASVPHIISVDGRGSEGEEKSRDYYDTLLTGKQPHQPQLSTMMKKEVANLIRHCLDTLAEGKTRFILAARYLEDVTLQDLAARFDCTAQAVHYQEKKGLEKMRSCLEQNDWIWDGEEID